jgi:vitamin B12 transporter
MPAEDLLLSIEGRHQRFYSRIDDVYSDPQEIWNYYLDEIWGVSTRLHFKPSNTNTLNLGFDEDWGKYDHFSEAQGVESKAKTRNWAIYANDTFTMGDFSFNAGIRYDDNRDFGGELSPSGGAVYRIIKDKALLRAQVAKGFSAPQPGEVHHPSIGNPDLQPETCINYQLGAEVRPISFLQLALNVFRADIDNLINYDSTTRKYENIDKASREGVEGAITAAFDSGFTLSFGGTFVDVKNELTHEVIQDRPRRLYNVSASYDNERMTHSLVGRYIYHNSTYPETKDKIFVFDYLLKIKIPLPDQYGKLSLFGAVHNITDASYVYREVYPQPDRWIEAGVNFVF